MNTDSKSKQNLAFTYFGDRRKQPGTDPQKANPDQEHDYADLLQFAIMLRAFGQWAIRNAYISGDHGEVFCDPAKFRDYFSKYLASPVNNITDYGKEDADPPVYLSISSLRKRLLRKLGDSQSEIQDEFDKRIKELTCLEGSKELTRKGYVKLFRLPTLLQETLRKNLMLVFPELALAAPPSASQPPPPAP